MVMSAEPLGHNFWDLVLPEIAPLEYKSPALPLSTLLPPDLLPSVLGLVCGWGLNPGPYPGKANALLADLNSLATSKPARPPHLFLIVLSFHLHSPLPPSLPKSLSLFPVSS